MSNRYGLSEKKVALVRQRDTRCIYCHKKMFTPSSDIKRGDWATIEHLNHLSPWNNPETIAICCFSCNASRGNKTIIDWFNSRYCKDRNISPKTVAQPVLEYIRNFEEHK